ncbi:MAG: pilus assembly protein CpaB [Actinomycetota bacterium]
MSPTPKKRSTILVLVGAVVFVLGTGLAALATRGSDGGGGSPNAAAAVTTTTAAPGSVAPPAPAPLSGFVIPAGHQALALDVPFVNGIAGYAKAGDHVNVFGVFKNNAANSSLPNPAAKLVLSNIEVLAVSSTPGANSTYVLSVDPSQAEQLVYLASFEGSYLTLAREHQGDLSTIGRTPKNEI